MDNEEAQNNENNENNEENIEEAQEDAENAENGEENELMYIYEWVDSVQLSRPKKNIARDFSDGLLLAEIIKSYLPRLVELHNYPSCSSIIKKRDNWNVLNRKVLSKIGIKLNKNEIEEIINIKPLAIEHLLQRVYNALQERLGINLGNPEKKNYRNINSNEITLQKILMDKENVIKQLKDIVEVLEMKLKNSEDLQKTLQAKVDDLTSKIRQKGIDV